MAAPLQSGQRVSAVSDHAEGWKDDEYVGYSICCKTSADKSRVLQAIRDNNSNSRARTMRVTEFTNFIFVEPAKPMNLSAFDSWRYRLGIRDLDRILHKDADTALEGLPSSMRPTRRSLRSRCMHFLPQKVGKGFRPPQLCWRSWLEGLDRSRLFASCPWVGFRPMYHIQV